MIKKMTLLVVSFAMVSTMIFANGASEKATTQAADQEGIKVWVSSGAEDEIYKELFGQIEQLLSIDIQDEYYPKDELDSKLQVVSIVGDSPDLIVVDYLQVPSYYEAGLINSLDSYVPEELLSDMLPSVIDESTYKGHLVSLAQFDSGMSFWANKSMLEHAGIRIPASYKNAWDKAEFEDALAKLKADGVPYPIYIRQNKTSTEYFTYLPIVASFGGSYVDEKKMLTSGALDSPETIDAFDYISWMIDKGYLNAACDYENGFFGRKESALSLIGHWKYKDHVDGLGDDAILIPIPDFGNGVFTCSGSTIWAMSTAAVTNGTDQLVWKVMEEALSPGNVEKVSGASGAIPSRKSVLATDPRFQEGGRLYLYREQLEGDIAIQRPLTPAHMTIYSAMKSAIFDIIHGNDAATTLHEVTTEVDEIIIENGWNK